MIGVADLPAEVVREALRHFGADATSAQIASRRTLREKLGSPGFVAEVVDRGPDGAAALFSALAVDGAQTVEALLGRGWAGVGQLPGSLGWLQRRALVAVGDAGLVFPVEEARHGYARMTFDLPVADDDAAITLRSTRTVLETRDASDMDAVADVAGGRIERIAPTVAISDMPLEALQAALESLGVSIADPEPPAAAPTEGADAGTSGQQGRPLPGIEETAVGPRRIRDLLQRALEESRQVRLQYFASSRGGQATERVVDPWEFADDLLRGWCHLREDERTFALDRIGRAKLLATTVEHAA